MITFTKVSLPFGWLGNMSPHPVVYKGETYRTSEALFQAMRFPIDSPIWETIRIERSPMGAKMAAKKNAALMVVEPRSPLDVAQMRVCLALKVEQHPLLVDALRLTNEEHLVEDASNRPNVSGLFWGMVKENGVWRGENVLGKCWMELREKEAQRLKQKHA